MHSNNRNARIREFELMASGPLRRGCALGLLVWAGLFVLGSAGFGDEAEGFPFPYELTDVSGRTLEARVFAIGEDAVEVERVADGRAFSIPLANLSEKDRDFFRERAARALARTTGDSEPALAPGEKLILDFPELGPMAGGKVAQCEISVPSSYDPSRPVPLLVWFSGGKGSHLTRSARGLVDFDRFLVVALPYPGGKLPRLAVDEGEDAIDAFWDFLQPMLEKVIERAPNISEEVRIAGGSSSGAHLVGSALDLKWRGFCDYFTGFILHEGGTSPEMRFRGTSSGHDILVIYGEESVAREWQDYFMERFERTSGRHSFVEVSGAGHGLNGKGRRRIREWIDETFEAPEESASTGGMR